MAIVIINGRALLTPVETAAERWYTVTEAAGICHRSRRTILNLIYKHNLRRRLGRQGRHPRRIILLSDPVLLQLRSLTRT